MHGPPPMATQPGPRRGGNIGPSNADPVIAPDGRSVTFVSLQRLDSDIDDITPSPAPEVEGTADIFRVPFPFNGATPERVPL